MTPEQFGKEIGRLKNEFKDLFDKYGPTIAGKTAVRYFKKNFQNEAWGRVKWQEVKRRTPGTAAYKYASKHHPARTTREILTGDTGDLGRSIEVKYVSKGEGGCLDRAFSLCPFKGTLRTCPQRRPPGGQGKRFHYAQTTVYG